MVIIIGIRKLKFGKMGTVTIVADRMFSCLLQIYTSELDKLVDCYNTTLADLLDHDAPLKTNTVTVRPQVPWYSEEVRVAKRLRCRFNRRPNGYNRYSEVKILGTSNLKPEKCLPDLLY